MTRLLALMNRHATLCNALLIACVLLVGYLEAHP